MLEPAQFLYTIAKPADKLDFVDGHCRLCGGQLFKYQESEPQLYGDVIGDTWKQEFLTRNKQSSYICPACSFIFGNISSRVSKYKPENQDLGKPLTGLFKTDRRGELNEEGKPRMLAAVIASRERGFQAFNILKWAEFGENLINPPKPPFLVLAATDIKKGIQYGPWQSIIALSRETYPVFFNYNVKTAGAEVLNSTLVWINPATFKKAVELAKKCLERKIKIPNTPDWKLAQMCAQKNNKEETK
ncbi:hypothetical protein ACOBQJ_03665 [Pelotomaculum propionicicum]|uniref:hypothetical protein n=1 Tax=Pelotomaculum propionicicum TaxID=258475 RepID=UPI003B761547